MSITIPTTELVGLITDVLAFTSGQKDDPSNGILLEWDGDNLHAAAYDVLSAGKSTWTPGEGDEGTLDENDNDAVIDLGHWGGDDARWVVFISADDAREIVKTFKLPAKYRLVPLLVKMTGGYGGGHSLQIERSKETGRTQHIAMFVSDTEQVAKFPDIDAIATEATANTSDTSGETFAAQRLAAFGGVRAHGLMHITFGEAGVASAVTIGSRFVGFIYAATSEATVAGQSRHAVSQLTDVREVEVRREGDMVPSMNAADGAV